MRPEEYLLIIARRWWLVLLSVVVAAGVAFAYSSTQAETYQTSTRLMAIAEPPDFWLDDYARNRLASYRDLMGNYDFVARALQDAGADIDPGHAVGALSIEHHRESNVVRLVVTDTDPARAATIANAVATSFVEWNELENQVLIERYAPDEPPGFNGIVRVTQLESASQPDTPIGPRTRLNTAAAAVLGLAFGVLLTFGISYFEDALRKPEDIDRYLELPTIASIPRQ